MSNNNSGGISTFGLLGVVFVTLKLVGIIDWSWWYVTMPFWGGLALVIAIFGGAAITAGLVLAIAWVGGLFYKKRSRYDRR